MKYRWFNAFENMTQISVIDEERASFILKRMSADQRDRLARGQRIDVGISESGSVYQWIRQI